ncbi:MAG: zinc ribbon domain-containing protein, partial [Actinomycetota bacterium]|nr:zinc ribbon domain-containing protein [Actinomycetota bacterium]
MTCPNCGTENAAEARFCVSCGWDLSDTTAPIPVAGEPTVEVPSPAGAPSATVMVPPPPGVPLGPGAPQVRPSSILSGGWLYALGRGVLAFAIVAVLGQAISFGAFAAAGRDSSFKTIARVGGVYFELFHRVGIEFRASSLAGSALSAVVGGPIGGLSYTLSIGLLLVTMLVVFLLYRAGRAVADRDGGSALARGVHGMKVAPFYGLLCFGLSFLIRFHVQIPSNP